MEQSEADKAKPQRYQVNVIIMEGRQLAITNANTKITVSIGKKKKSIHPKTNKTDSPYFNDFCTFPFFLPLNALLNEILVVKVYQISKLIKKFVGSFSVELSTVWAQPNHRFYRKWAVLINPKNQAAGMKGFLKCDISILAKGIVAKPPREVVNEDVIEENLLVPHGGIQDRYRAKIVFSVFRADSISPHFLKIPDFEVLRPYVKITYAGSVVKTNISKSKESPVWNEELSFLELIPPLCQNIFIELCDRHKVRHTTSLGNATVDMYSLYEDGMNGFLPTFGPTFVYLYHPLKKFEHHKHTSILQNSFTYSCRLLLAVRTEIMNHAEEVKVKRIKTKKFFFKPIPPILETSYFKYQKFILFGVVFDVLFFDKKFIEKNVNIRLTLGPKKTSGIREAPEEIEQIKTTDENPFENPVPVAVETSCNTTSNQQVKFTADYGFIAFSGQFPCAHVYGEWPDSLRKVYRTNVIKKVVENCTNEINKVKCEMEFEDEKSLGLPGKLKGILSDLSRGCEVILLSTNVIKLEDTNLCREKKRVYDQELAEIAQKTKIDSTKEALVAEDELDKISAYLNRLTKYAQDPEHSFPDTEIWILRNRKITAQFRVKTEDIAYSSNLNERGIMSGKTQTLIIRGKKQRVKAKLDMFLWFGLADDFIQCMNMLPSGYKQDNSFCTSTADSRIPTDITYEEKHYFQCRAHIYQAKILVGFDQTGLADPFARVIILGEDRASQVRKATLSPIWNETLIFSQIILYGPLQYIKENSITITVEVFDKEKATWSELIGRTFVKPVVKLSNEKYEPPHFPPKLRWEDIQQEFQEVGKILMVAELLELSDDLTDLYDSDSTEKSAPIKIPENISPNLTKYRLEILFWGVRDLKKKRYTRNKLFVVLECGETVLQSPTIKNARHKQNFPGFVQYLDLNLPEEPDYAPPLTLKLFHIESVTKAKNYVGNCISANVRYFSYHSPRNSETNELIVMGGNNDVKTKKFEKFEEKKRNYYQLLKKQMNAQRTCEKILYAFARCFRYCRCKLKRKCQNGAYEGSLIKEKEAPDWWLKYHASVEGSDVYPGIPNIKIYHEELEAQPEFKGFTDFLKTFKMVVGPKKKLKEGISVGKVKAVLRLYQRKEMDDESQNKLPGNESLSNSPSNDAVKYVVRAYIICGKNLAPRDINGKSDPYLYVKLGNQKISDRINYAPKQLNPTFGKCFEFTGTFPQEHLLQIKVIDYDSTSKDDLIGETLIDIENRYYSKHHATCGLAKTFEKEGFNAWRDIFLPTYILETLCHRINMREPVYEKDRVIIENLVFNTTVPHDVKYREEIQALSVLNRWHEVPQIGFHLVPEHIETRSLYHPSLPGIEQGKLEMWVDIFPADYRYMPPKVDVRPRRPIPMELRAIVWNVDDVVLDDKTFFFHEKMSDIYVKGWILSLEEETQKTDIHFRSLNGEGSFNWRFIFHFNYIPTERMIVVKKKANAFDVQPEERKHHCKLEIQIWDNDAFGDDYLGTLILELAAMPRGAMLSNRCTLKMLAPNSAKINLFKIGKTRGWWPFRRLKAKQKVGNEFELTGKIDLELEVLTEAEAVLSPAGKGRDDPKGLPPPVRPATSFNWMLNPWKTFRYIIWRKVAKILLIGLLIVIVVFFLLVGIYSFPNYMVKKMIGA